MKFFMGKSNGKYVFLGICVIVALAIVYYVQNPDEFNKLLNPPPDVQFYDTNINKNELIPGSIAIISVNAINNEFEPVSVKLTIEVIGENAEQHLSFPKEVMLGTLENNGEVFEFHKPVQILAKDVSGKSIPFDIVVNLIVKNQITASKTFPITIVSI